MARRLLVIKCTLDYHNEIVDHLKSIASLSGVEGEVLEFKDLQTFEQEIRSREPYDFLYLAAHGNHSCFGEESSPPTVRWADFGEVLCRTEILKPGSILFLGCCHGGLKKVALILFHNCENITSLCGLKWSGNSREFLVAFHSFLFNVCCAKEEPEIAVNRAASSIGRILPFYSRYDYESDLCLLTLMDGRHHEDYSPTSQLSECIGREQETEE